MLKIVLISILITSIACLPGTSIAADEAQIEKGRAIYNYRCYFCHGYSGDAKTLASSYLTPKPRDFTDPASALMTSDRMIDAVTNGRPGTAMTGFSRLLDSGDINALVTFIQYEFIEHQNLNTSYHTPENGWVNHQKYRIAFPFATGKILLDKPDSELSEDEMKGKQLYLTSCITCHDRANVAEEGLPWTSQSLSFPRNNYSHKEASEGSYPTLGKDISPQMVDGITAASVHALHDIAPQVLLSSDEVKRGKIQYEKNCAFCHAADGTGKNWIGSFLSPKPRDLTDPSYMQSMDENTLKSRILSGIPGTSMPAWRQLLTEKEINDIISYLSAAFHPIGEN